MQGTNLLLRHTQFRSLLNRLISADISSETRIKGSELGFGDRVVGFFRVALIPDKNLPSGIDIMVHLIDEATHSKSKAFLIVIFVNPLAFKTVDDEQLCQFWLNLVLTHELCHIVRYYEIWLENNDYHSFKTEVSCDFKGVIMQGTHAETEMDHHSADELLRRMGQFNQSHYVRYGNSKTDYPSLFNTLNLYLMTK